MIDISTIKSLEDTYHFLLEVFLQSHRIQPLWRPGIILLLQSKTEQQEVKALEVILELEVVGEATAVVVHEDE